MTTVEGSIRRSFTTQVRCRAMLRISIVCLGQRRHVPLPRRRKRTAPRETRRAGPRNEAPPLSSRGQDLNLRPLGYEPSELPDCSTPHTQDRDARLR